MVLLRKKNNRCKFSLLFSEKEHVPTIPRDCEIRWRYAYDIGKFVYDYWDKIRLTLGMNAESNCNNWEHSGPYYYNVKNLFCHLNVW